MEERKQYVKTGGGNYINKSNYYTNPTETYNKIRHDEKKYAKFMVHLFNSAANSFKAGDFKNAKKFSELGRQYKAKFHQIKQENIDRMFNTLNSQEHLDQFVDLHGLHKEEAIVKLSKVMQEIKSKVESGVLPVSCSFQVITGRGNNSKDGISVIKPWVEQYLRENDFKFTIAPDKGSYFVSFS